MNTTIAAASAFFSALAGLAALWQVRKAISATEATILLAMTERYGQPAMRDAIRSLASFGRDARAASQEVQTYYKDLMKNDAAAANSLRAGSRIISSYFCDAYRLSEAGLVSRRTLRYIVSHPGINVFYDVAIPINRAKNQNHNSISAGRSLKTLLTQHGDGFY